MSPETSEPPLTDELEQVVGLMNAGQYIQAEHKARALLCRCPDAGFLWKVYGVALLRQAKDALPALQRATQLLPDDAETHYYAGSALQTRGDLTAALTSYNTARQLRPGYSAALIGLADTCMRLGRPAEAVTAYRQALEHEPAAAQVHNNLGNALLQLRDAQAAAASYTHALHLKPSFAEAHSNLGNALRALGQPASAIICYARALAIKPDLADAHNNLGNTLLQLGQLDDAVSSYRRALKIQPDFADAHTNLGNALRDLGRLHEALASYDRALEIRPDLAEAHNNHGNVCLDLLQLDEAAESYQHALVLKPDYVHALTGLAMVRRQQGRTAEAEATCRRALDLEPDAAQVIAFLAEIHADRGRFDAAEELFRKALALDPELPAAWAGIARYRRMGAADTAWLEAAERLAESGLPLRHKINLRYAIGKYFDDTQDYPRAFASYKLANELTQTYGARYNRVEEARNVDRIVSSYGRKWLDESRQGAPSSQRPVFVVGVPRSGTTLVEQILASHPAVFGAGELPFWNDASAANDNNTIPALAARYLKQLESLSAAALRVVDKMPNNYVNLGLIHAALPGSRIIHVQRNPLDTCLSIFFQNFSIGHAYANDLEDLAHFYTMYLQLMRHWRTTLPPDVMLEVPYESLVVEPEAWSRKMLEFIGLPWDPRCLDFQLTDRTVITPSKWQVRQKISTRSVGRWRHYADFIEPLHRLLPLVDLGDSHSSDLRKHK